MDIQELKSELSRVHENVLQKVKALGASIITTSVNGKWSAAQHLKHLELSLAPVARLLSDKEKLISKNLGKSEKGSRTYDELMNSYRLGLSYGIVSPANFVPPDLTEQDLSQVYADYTTKVNLFANALDLYDEFEMDSYQLIHPLLGHLTIKEFAYFYMYHAEHHWNNIDRAVKELLKC